MPFRLVLLLCAAALVACACRSPRLTPERVQAHTLRQARPPKPPMPPAKGRPKPPRRTAAKTADVEKTFMLFDWPVDSDVPGDVTDFLRAQGMHVDLLRGSIRMAEVWVRVRDADRAWSAIRGNKALADRLGDTVPPVRVDDPDGLE
jgi:hypothetical protein